MLSIFDSDELEELENVDFENEGFIDQSIEKVKECNKEIEQLEQIYKQRVEMLEKELENKKEKLEKKKQWFLNNLKGFALNSPNLKSTATQYKLNMLSGDIIIKKPKQTVVKPSLDEEEIKLNFKDYSKEKTKIELDWKNLKKNLLISDGKVINTKTGKDLSDIIKIEEVPEEVVVK